MNRRGRRERKSKSFLMFALAMLFHPDAVSAQSNLPPRGFVAGSLIVASTDTATVNVRCCGEGMPTTSSSRWLLGGAVYLVDWAALGVEFRTLPRAAGDYYAASFNQTDEETETVLTPHMRARFRTPAPRVALEALFGVGIVFQRVHTRSQCNLNCGRNDADYAPVHIFENHRLLSWMMGIEMPIQALPHLVVAPTARMYLRDGRLGLARRFVARPDGAFAFGFSVGGSW